MSVLAALSIFPTNQPGTSLSPYVARVLNVIAASGLPHELGPMSTSIEGEWDEVMQVVTACFRELEPDCDRVYMTMSIDYRADRTDGLNRKVASVRAKQASGK
ncbi:MTH1187 family thiamine-binding protein [Pseudodesulfovibrio tunisiensis]|uniref:MTH1187 family thiamine-binding protein n=1 Tax=Pseudodesulfovibrio tunisiensis TaxID=463192 RepID=UPI001FB462CF|nr:MTH1187 family thiamine-binding protein [Pseudodesulfovibrio tunisiensis]